MADTELKPAAELAKLISTPFPGASEEYERARKALLGAEIELRRHDTAVSAQRRALPPGPVVEKDYRFIDGNGEDVGLAGLFGAHDTLVTYFWMYGPERPRPCPMCTAWLSSVNGNAVDIKQRVALKILGRSPVERQMAFAEERGWRGLDFVQIKGDDYAKDLGGLTEEGWEYPILATYRKDGDKVRLYYLAQMPMEAADPGQDPRSPPEMAAVWNVLDLTPGGRGTDWYPKLSY